MGDEERKRHGKEFYNLFQQQNRDNYMDQEGHFAYLVSVSWFERWKLFSYFYQIQRESVDSLRKKVNKQNMLTDEDDNLPAFLNKIGLDTDADFAELKEQSSSLEDFPSISPIFNDDILTFNYPLL
jgi:hypothetical protein